MEYFDELLKIDPLALAEKLTGKSYKEDKDTSHLGLGLAMLVNQRKRDELSTRDDTYHGSSYADAIRIIEELGFQFVYVEQQQQQQQQPDGKDEMRLYWRAGILLFVESYAGKRVNNISIHYNWRHAPDLEDRFNLTSSGHYHTESYDAGEHVWIGQHDVREAFRHKLALLEANGKFLETWVECPFIYVVPYWDRKSNTSCDYRQRLDFLPEEVKKHLTVALSKSS
jgi:hypothetical protein